MKRIAIIGSSGGNLYMQGGNNPPALLGEIFTQAASAGIEVGFVEFIGATRTMDGIPPDSPAKLYLLDGSGGVSAGEQKELQAVNADARAEDAKLAQMIQEGRIDGLILMSCDPTGTNEASIKAAAEKKLPCVGTGGASMANTQKLGANVVAASGTTGTTNRTRAVSFVSSLAKEWKLKYRPVIGKTAGGGVEANVWKRINFRGIMMASLPGFIAMALTLAISKIPGLGGLEDVFNALIEIIPVIVAAIAAKQISGLDEVGIVAGIVAGFLAKDGGLIGGLAAGIIAGVLAYYIIILCFKWKVPGTTANIAAGGIGGLVAGLVGKFALAPIALFLGNGINDLISAALSYNAVLAGAIAGLLIWPAIIGGVYHAAILPIVLLEMEAAGFSFLGAIDMTGLVMVSAGITLANVVFPRQKSDAAAALPGFLINVCFGTFVEASYPFMFSSKLVFGSALISAGVSGLFVGLFNVKGTAYVPAVMAPFMANPGKGFFFALCMLIAMGLAFVLTAIANKVESRKALANVEH
ncbi:MAG: PTS sugar transporter [Oscillibacter sp.]|jgi:fructose-specific phosphotransferase system IIC component|nr:PTS sugar transporter [Oscillibacter sp.]